MITLDDLTNEVRELVTRLVQQHAAESDIARGDRTAILLNGVNTAINQLQGILGNLDRMLAAVLESSVATPAEKSVVSELETTRATVNVIVARLEAATVDPSTLKPALDATPIVSETEIALRIARHVATAKSFTLEQLQTKERASEIALCRQVICWLLRRHTTLQITVIGRLLHRDHSTVLYSIQTIDYVISGRRFPGKPKLKKLSIPNLRNKRLLIAEILQFDADAAEIRRLAQERVRAPKEERPNQESKPLHRQAREHSPIMVTTGGGDVKSGAIGNKGKRR